MTNLQLVLHESFNARPVDVYRDPAGTEMMTRQQIAAMLGISVNAIDQLHRRYRDRLEQFSVTDKLSGADGKQYKTYLFLPTALPLRKERPMK